MVYNYTKPRGPVAAMYNSPGPCYGLPTLVGHEGHDPRSVHTKGPAYPFGRRTKKDGDSCGPGPCHYPDKIYRSGKDGTPRYSMAFRQQELRGLQTPGPGAYSVGSEKPTSLSYSFGRRHHDPSADNTPAPNRYDALPMLGKTYQSTKRRSPAYTLTGRNKYGSFSDDFQKTPGPGTYRATDTNRYKSQPPIYSLTSRNEMPGDISQKPGPGAHSVKQSWNNKRASPSFSFGIRHSQYEATLILDSSM